MASENESRKREQDRKYVKFKSKRVKRAKKRGNNAAAQRHATELIQYLGLDEGSETPIEGILAIEARNESQMSGDDRLQQLRQRFGGD